VYKVAPAEKGRESEGLKIILCMEEGDIALDFLWFSRAEREA
jgi:hypothetical protein